MWDDSDMTPTGIGGRCLNAWQASKRLKDGRGSLQEVVVPLSHDGHLAGDFDSFATAYHGVGCSKPLNPEAIMPLVCAQSLLAPSACCGYGTQWGIHSCCP